MGPARKLGRPAAERVFRHERIDRDLEGRARISEGGEGGVGDQHRHRADPPEQACRTRQPLYWWLLTSRRWTPPRPINVYVIEHANGLVLFDTGQDRASVTDSSYFPRGVTGYLYHRLARFDIGEDDTLTAQLAALGYTAADVDTTIVSHLHEDHIGGLRELTGAKLMVSAAEWAELAKPAPQLRGFLRRHIQIPGLTWHQVSPQPTDDPTLAPFTESLDVTGDGT